MGTVERWVTWMKAEGRAAHTVQNRQRRITLFGEYLGRNPADASQDDVINYLATLNVEIGTRATYFAHLRSWFAWLTDIGYREDNPTLKIKVDQPERGKSRHLKPEQVELVLEAPMRRRTRMMVLLALREGLRVHEIAKVKGEDVDLTGRTLRVTGKGGKKATLPLHPEVIAYAAGFPRLGPWFPGPDGKPIKARSVSDTLADLLRRAGVPGGGHRLRHTFGTNLQVNGNSLLTTQTLMRHEDPSSTAIYAAPSDEQLQQAIEGLGAS